MKTNLDEPPGLSHRISLSVAARLTTAAFLVGLLHFQAPSVHAGNKSAPVANTHVVTGLNLNLTLPGSTPLGQLPSLEIPNPVALPGNNRPVVQLPGNAQQPVALPAQLKAVEQIPSHVPSAPVIPGTANGALVQTPAISLLENAAAQTANFGGQGNKQGASAEQNATDAAKLFDDADVKGKTLLLVGTRGSRPFILQETVRVAKKLGLNLILLDKPENRKNSIGIIPDSHFIAAPIDQRDDASIKGMVMMVAAFAAWRKVDAVIAFRSHHAQLVGRIVDEIKSIGVPAAPVITSDNKAKLREKLQNDPELAVPARKIKSADEARAAYREMGGGRFVIKSIHGENSRFVNVDIFTEDDAAAAYTKMDADLRAYAKLSESSDTIFNKYPGIMMERFVGPAPGTHEASVELVMQAGKAVFAMVSDTHGIGKNNELAGGSMTFPSQQTPDIQKALIAAAAKACRAIGLVDGNARVDITMTPSGPAIIEINPYLGGAAIWKAVKLVTGVSLVEWGIRALLRLKLPKQPKSTAVVDYRFAASEATGEIVSVEGQTEAEAVPGAAHVQVLLKEGDHVTKPVDNGFEEWAEVMGIGANLDEARANSVAALEKLKAKVKEDQGGGTVEQTGDYLQPKP